MERSSQQIMLPSESVMGSELSASALSGMTQSSNPMVSITTNHLFFIIYYLLLSKIWCILCTNNILPSEFWKNKGFEGFCTTKNWLFAPIGNGTGVSPACAAETVLKTCIHAEKYRKRARISTNEKLPENTGSKAKMTGEMSGGVLSRPEWRAGRLPAW